MCAVRQSCSCLMLCCWAMMHSIEPTIVGMGFSQSPRKLHGECAHVQEAGEGSGLFVQARKGL